ncbi:MAG: hypothetical protein C0613_10405 [Desulfobulbaceae bacterium]|nr:MAG: hypothetical protein C0613_10405 [Desulfobulbaceae bacterium]
MTKHLIILLVTMLLVGCSGEEEQKAPNQRATNQAVDIAQPLARQEISQPLAANDNLLLFFLNPNGGPCRMQDRILKEMAADLKERVTVRYVQTTVQSDMNLFYQYGIRSLPSLVLTSSTGKELGRLTPGVHNAAAVLGLVTDHTDS